MTPQERRATHVPSAEPAEDATGRPVSGDDDGRARQAP
jgi:hypothetical protein